MTEEKITEGLRNRDKKVLEYFNRKYYSFMVSVAMRVVKNKEDAEDVVQESFLKVLKGIHKFSPENSLKGWLYKIVHRCAITHYNQNKRHKKCEDLTGYEPLQLGSSSFSESLQAGDLIRQALRKLQMVSSNQYMYARLHFEEGLNYKEIAKDIDVPEGTVKSQISRASESLRQIIREFDKVEI